MNSLSPFLSLAAIGAIALCPVRSLAETVILRQTFDELASKEYGTLGFEGEKGGSWKTFQELETAPTVTDEEFVKTGEATTGKSVRIMRDDSLTATNSFWLIGTWDAQLESGKVRIKFSVLRDSPESGFSVHFGTAEKYLGDNTIAVAIGNTSTSGEKLGVMMEDGTWRYTDSEIPTGIWAEIGVTIDFASSTYSASINGSTVVEDVPFTFVDGLRTISFLPTVPDKNVSFIDNVEVVILD